MNTSNIIFYDFETGGPNPFGCQPTQLSAIAIDGRRLNIIENSVFNSLIKPIFDEKQCQELGLDQVQDEALELTKLTKEQLEKAPELKVVWQSFCAYVEKYKKGKSIFSNPIRSGYNIDRFDNVICDRIMGGKSPWGFGPWDSDRQEQRLFHPRDCIDLMRCYVWPWTENNSDIKSISMDALCEWLGIEHSKAHNAVADVIVGANVLIRFMKLTRSIAPKVQFEQSMAQENETIKQYIEEALK